MTKRCPKCGQSFADPNLNFCLNDGELLMYADDGPSTSFEDEPPPTKYADDDSPPTLMMNNPRATDPIGWAGTASPPARWQGQQIVTPPGHHPVQYAPISTQNQILGILSIIFGACSLTIGWCCSTGLLFGPAAIVLGIIALIQNKNDPAAYGGRGLAIGGIVTGALFLVGYLLLIIIYGIAVIGGGIR